MEEVLQSLEATKGGPDKIFSVMEFTTTLSGLWWFEWLNCGKYLLYVVHLPLWFKLLNQTGTTSGFQLNWLV